MLEENTESYERAEPDLESIGCAERAVAIENTAMTERAAVNESTVP